MPGRIICLLLFVLISLCPQTGKEQQQPAMTAEQALAAGDNAKAFALFGREVAAFKAEKNYDTLLHYIVLAGKIAAQREGNEKVPAAVFSFIDDMKTQAPTVFFIKAYRQATEFFDDLVLDKQAYIACALALQYSQLAPGRDSEDLARSEYNMGVYAHRLGNIGESELHHRRALAIRKATHNTSAEDLYLSSNAMGILMWYTSRYDSARVFFNQALSALAALPANDLNKYYRSANVYNNLAALYSGDGRTSDAMDAMHKTIDYFQQFIAGKQPHPKKKEAVAGLLQAIDNLAGIYQEIGDYGKGGELLLYSYHQKLQKLDPAKADIFISEILLGQHYNAVNDYDKALYYLNSGLAKLEKTEGDYLFWNADGNYAKALAYENKKMTDSAAACYERSQQLYEASYQGAYDNVYMDFLRNAALFYAKNGYYEKAKNNAAKVYNYLVTVNQEKGLQGFYQLLNMAEIEYLSAHYTEAVQKSTHALSVIGGIVKSGATLLDSVKIDVFKPKAVLIKVQSQYQLRQKRDSSFLKQAAGELNEALSTLAKRKVLIDDAESINILLADNAELIAFAKKIQLELFEMTGDDNYLDNFINLHESGLYNRIRSNLDKEKAIRFANLPENIQQEEQRLKEAIPAALQGNGDNKTLINAYLEAVSRWNDHLELIRVRYPEYYTMRYATLVKHLPQLQSTLPQQTTLVRYFFTDNSLLALVADSNHKQLVRLEGGLLPEQVKSLSDNRLGEQEQLHLLNQLYHEFWEPIEKNIHTDKVMIIPDGALFNVGFDMLAAKPVSSFSELRNACLLSKYTLSYHYSLFMLDQNRAQQPREDDYIAFVPGFSDNVKDEYRSHIKDSVDLDYQYLSLLPQPNTSKLAQKIKQMLHGTAYMNGASTHKSFIKNAAGHKIIHIGTHAEYNNTQPERSRLIFAKDITADNDTNSLYLSDIYNCNITSDLAILTACESGRPGYRDGEGMISLAHAFNYAGSKMILTSLWKLDEQSSNIITDYFVQNLLKQMPADEALRQAKLRFLQQAKGRMQAPAYWAGMILMGKPAVITVNNNAGQFPWLLSLSLIILLIPACLILLKRKHRSKKIIGFY